MEIDNEDFVETVDMTGHRVEDSPENSDVIWGDGTGFDIKTLQVEIERLKELREAKEKRALDLKITNEQYELQRSKIRNIMESEDLDRFDHAGLTVLVSEKHNYRLDQERLREFIDYVGERMTFEQFITLCKPNAQSLQSWVKNELESGEITEIPGVKRTEYYELSVRKK